MSRARLVALAALAVAAARVDLVLSAPDWLAAADEATWKHAAVARRIADGESVDVRWLLDQAWHPFNFHQAGWLPFALAYAAIAAVSGTGYVQLHLFDAAFGVLGAASWVAVLDRHAGRCAAVVGAAVFTLLPLPAAALSVRPWSGHVEAQGLAALAVALAGRPLACGLATGAALSFSPLAAPLLGSAAAAALACRLRPSSWTRLGAGLALGILPYGARALFAPVGAGEVPVLEDPASVLGNILAGGFGPGLARALWPPFHLVVHAENIAAASSWRGMPGGDDLPANLALGLAGVAALLLRPPGRAERALAVALGATPWATLAMVGLAGPDLALRYVAGTYFAGAATFGWLAGRVGSWSLPLVLAAAATWVLPGAADLARVTAPSRWAQALGYAPDAWTIRAQLDATPPLALWPGALAFLEHRRAQPCCRSAMGFGAAFRPFDTRSAQGWQPRPAPGPEMARHALALVRGQQATGVDPDREATLPLVNLGWGLALAAGGDRSAVEGWLDATDATAAERAWIAAGIDESERITPPRPPDGAPPPGRP